MEDQEFETTVLDIDTQAIISQLRELNAEELPEVLTRRWVFDIHPTDPEFIRLRDNGDKITLTYKKKGGSEVGSTTEIEVEVDDFEKTAQILSKIKSYSARYQETKRHLFKLNEIEFSIDTWPKIPPYLEIEAGNKEKVQEGLKLLGLEDKDSGDIDIVEIFQKHNIDLNSIPIFKFD